MRRIKSKTTNDLDTSVRPNDQESWLKLACSEIYASKLASLLKAYDFDAQRILGASQSDLKRFGLTPQQLERLAREVKKDKSKELDKLGELGIRMVTLGDTANYPPRLRTIIDPPPILFVRGELIPDDQFAVAIVGSRKATAYGLSLSRKFGHDLAAGGLCLVSGGARGVDTEAHIGALEGNGRTIGVFGCGLDMHYPPENDILFERIVNEGRGALISEYPPGSTPDPWHFPARNRIISGLSMGVLLIETPIQSGAMITAHQAADQGRDVMAIPGPVDTDLSAGCHKLIQDGAKLVQSVDDIFEELGVLKLKLEELPVVKAASTTPSPIPKNLTPTQQRIIAQLTLEPKTLDQLSDSAEVSAHEASSALTILELNRLARKIGGQGFVRVL